MTITHAHVAVVGAGAIGVSIAAELASRGTRVTLIEARTPGSGTSQVTYGWLNSNGKEPDSYFAINHLGLRRHRAEQTASGADRAGAPWLGTPGHIEIARDDEHIALMTQRVDRLRARDYPARFITAREARELEPGLRLGAGEPVIAYFAEETYLFPALYIADRLQRFRAAGGTLRIHTAVTDIAERAGGARLGLSDGTALDVDAVVSTVGRWTAELAALAGITAPLVTHEHPGDATVGYLVETEAAPIALSRMVTSPKLNLRPNGGGRLLLQALDLDETADPAAPPAADSPLAAEFRERLSGIITGGEFARVDRVHVGRRAIPADGRTIAGRAAELPWLYLVATHSGITLAPFLGEAVADELGGGERPELADFRPARFQAGGDNGGATGFSAPRIPGQQ